MRIYELFEDVVPTDRYVYQKYKIVFQTKPDKNGLYIGQLFKDNVPLEKFKNNNLEQLKRDMENAVHQIEISAKRNALVKRDVVDTEAIKRVALNYNTQFTRQVLDNEIPTATRLGSENRQAHLDVMTREAFEVFNDDLKTLGFTKITDRQWSKKENVTKIFGISNVNPKLISQLGLEFHGVYELKVEKSPDPQMFTRYELEQLGYSDKDMSYPVPAVTIAFWYKDGSYSEEQNASS